MRLSGKDGIVGKHTGQRVQEYMHHIFVLLQTIKLLVLSSCHINLPDF